jgi:hypothetical protein
MTTKRPDSFEEFQRKQTEKRAASPSPTHNTPDLPSLSHEEHTYVDAAREALATMKRTFEFWMLVARGLQALKDKADRIGGRFTFDRLREREGLGGKRKDGTDILNKTRVSRLLAILDHASEVEGWRKDLADKQRFEWASPEAVWRHCPVFANPKPADENKPLSAMAQLKQVNIVLQEENHKLKQREDGDRWKPSDTAADIATVIVGMFSTSKAEQIAKLVLAKLKKATAA